MDPRDIENSYAPTVAKQNGVTANEMSLFDVEDVEEMPKVRDMIVAPVSNSDVTEFSRRYHYTGLPGNALWRWGLWHGPVLHGVVAYNTGNRGLGASIIGEEHASKVWHMGRLMLSEDSPRNSESRLIGGSLQAIERSDHDVWAVVTFADENHGHIGTIYQATNAYYTGITDMTTRSTSRKYYVNEHGEVRSFRSIRKDAEHRGGIPGWTMKFSDKPKHRYVYILGNKSERRQRLALLKHPILPYPKRSAA